MSKDKTRSKNTKRNGKGDSPRNNLSKAFKDNYQKINWNKKKS